MRLFVLFATLSLMTAVHADHAPARVEPPASGTLRFATFNASLESAEAGALLARLVGGADAQARHIAAIIQAARPHVLLVNEFDFDPSGEAARIFVDEYLGVGQSGLAPIHYAYRFAAPVNTGVPSGFDLNRDGRSDGPGDAWGYRFHPGQFGMLVLSAFPVDSGSARTFQRFLWQRMPQAQRPVDPVSGDWFWPDETWARVRLSSKSHWDLPLDTPLGRIHLLAAHPTPPVFDGPENRNGQRNFDEIRLWADYIDPTRGAYLEDDQGVRGALAEGAAFVIAGDYNADPIDGASVPGAIQQLLEHPRIDASLTPRSEGGIESSAREGGVNLEHRGDPAHDTSEFGGDAGNLRVDYVLPSRELNPVAAGIFWPRKGDPGADWVTASDHRLVWVDIMPRSAPATAAPSQ
ncbi:MAG TPA: endonuclease/exonuclease/phosphatase family protein [Xanthomonadaceae bacterium]|nr:endonuclease/exonuclease/phosphatase family protein [Xanthomonadaceae bacterium]